MPTTSDPFFQNQRNQGRSKSQSQITKDKVHDRKRCRQLAKSRFKSADMFGQSVGLTWNGQETYKTLAGAGFSWAILLIMAAYSLYRIIFMINRYNPSLSKVTLIRPPNEDLPFKPQQSGFSFAFSLNTDLDPSFGYFSVNYVNQSIVNRERLKQFTPLGIQQCRDTLFEYDDFSEIQSYKIDEFQCLQESEQYELQGNFYRSEMKYVEIQLKKCRNGTKGISCKSRQVIDDYFRNEKFNFAFTNTMFVLDNYQDTIQTFIDDQLFFQIDPNVCKKANFFVQEQFASLEDDIIQIGQNKQITFHQVVNIKTYEDNYDEDDGSLVVVYIRADKQYDSYERKVIDVMVLMGDLGGLLEFFKLIGEICVGFIAQKMFMSSIVRKIYHIRKYDNIEYEAKKRMQVAGSENADFSIRGDEEAQRSRGINEGKLNETSIKQTLGLLKYEEDYISEDFKNKSQIEPQDIYSLFFAFLNRARFRYNPSDITEYILKCLCIRNSSYQRRLNSIKPHYLFEKAEDKFMNELDIVRVVRSLRKFKMLAQAMLSQRHRMILRFQRQNLIETSSSSSDSDDNLYDPVRLMENPNPLIRLVTYGKVKKMMKEFVGQRIDPLEKNLMRGMFRRKLKDFAETQRDNNQHLTLIERLKMGHYEEEDENDVKAKDQFRQQVLLRSKSNRGLFQKSQELNLLQKPNRLPPLQNRRHHVDNTSVITENLKSNIELLHEQSNDIGEDHGSISSMPLRESVSGTRVVQIKPLNVDQLNVLTSRRLSQ
ncbi:hypothetical protein FGO68_gene10121 [Halteria grandinella]|uniref:Uncharacterized protein n=1 Tax=Halteria grandinella TaxID=5974 RepID=A0A8J8T5Q0_HALGN|nr:hypothetical protein FGO68_gene10121 [Halteria grandinella]